MSPTEAGGEVRVAITACPDAGLAGSIARTLVEERWIACGNVVGGVRSIYRWRGAVETAGEALLVMKTVAARIDGLADRLAELHPYDVPELVVLDVERGSPEYLRWVVEETRGGL